jgi:subtilisin family serine protease
MLSKRIGAPVRRALQGLLCAALLGLAAPGPALAADPVVPAQVLVKLRSDSDLAGLLARHGLTLAARFGARPIYRLAVIGNAVLADKIAALQADPAVVLAETNTVHRSPEARKNLVWVIGTAQEYAVQWAPQAIRLSSAHRRSIGTGVRVAVLDTGVDIRHPALVSRLLPGYDFVDGDTDPSEQGVAGDGGWGHGTHVAGIVAMVAPGARIMPLRVLDAQGQGNTWVLAEAMLHAIDPDHNPATDDGAHVINLSLGTVDPTQLMGALTALASCSFVTAPDPLDDYTDAGYNDDRQRCGNSIGAVVVAAAGNGGDPHERQYPAAEGAYGLIPVGATKAGSLMADFSNSGSWINLAAPGDHITSTLPGGGYGTWGGTSMAAPMVAGAAALLRALEPTLVAVDVVRRLERRSAALCGKTKQRQLDVGAAVAGSRPANLVCP